MAGFELTNGSVHVKTVALNGSGAEVSAEIRTAFKFEKDKQGNWRVAEFRTGPSGWENIDLIALAMRTQVANDCSAPDPPLRKAAASDPSAKRVRCLLGNLLGIDVPSDAVRIQEVTPFAIPLASQPSALAIAWVKVDVRLVTDGKAGWKVSELRTGTRNWVSLESLVGAVNDQKRMKARGELETIARALEEFRRDRGFYVVSDQQSVAIDHLSPRYLSPVIRVDPWNQPYKYQGERDHYILTSSGPDRKDATSDDIRLANPSR